MLLGCTELENAWNISSVAFVCTVQRRSALQKHSYPLEVFHILAVTAPNLTAFYWDMKWFVKRKKNDTWFFQIISGLISFCKISLLKLLDFNHFTASLPSETFHVTLNNRLYGRGLEPLKKIILTLISLICVTLIYVTDLRILTLFSLTLISLTLILEF